MSSLRRPRCLFSAVALALAGCGETVEPIACTEEARPGVMIEVVSDVDGSPLSAGISGELVSGGHQEDLASLPGHNVLFGAIERPGTYDATIRATGFESLEIQDITVDADECHVITEERRARLMPS